jgi:hypothetical protein
MIEMDIEELRRKYPNLARELKERVMCVEIRGSRTSDEGFQVGMPDAIDYIRAGELRPSQGIWLLHEEVLRERDE